MMNSLMKPTTKMILITEDLNDPSVPKDALLILKTGDQIFPLLVDRKLPVVLGSPNVLILHSSAQDAPVFLLVASLRLRELSAPSPMRPALVDLAAPLFLPVSLITQVVPQVPLALNSLPVPRLRDPADLDLPSTATAQASTVPSLVTNDLTSLSAHRLRVSALRAPPAPTSLIVP